MMSGEAISETRISNGHDAHGRRELGVSRVEPRAKEGSLDSRPGILIFSCRQQMLHMNHRALELTGQLHDAALGPVNASCAASVRELRTVIQETLGHRRAANMWEYFELKHIIVDAGRKILVRGFGLADRNSFADSRIVIVLEEIGPRQERSMPQTHVMVPVSGEEGRCSTRISPTGI